MDIAALYKSSTHPITAALTVVCAVIGLGIPPSYASQIVLPFTVTVSLTTTGGLCRDSSKIGSFGADVVVMCTSGRTAGYSGDVTNLPETPMQDGMYRYVTLASGAGEPLGTLKSYPAAGTVTSWRIVNLAKRDYIEMMVGW